MRAEEGVAGISSSTHLESALLDQAQTALVAVDQNGLVTHWNRHAEVLLGYSADEVIGQDLRDLWAFTTGEMSLEQVLTKVGAGAGWEADVAIRTERSRCEVHMTLSPIVSDEEVVGAVAVAFDIAYRLRSERRLAASLEVTGILSASEHIFAAAPALLESICRNFEWNLGALWGVDRPTGRLRCLEITSIGDHPTTSFEEATRWLTLERGEGIPGLVVEARGSRWFEDLSNVPSFPRSAAAEEVGFRSGVACPILLHGEVLGVMEFFSTEQRPPDEDLIEMLAAIGSQVGQFMERRQAEEDRSISEARTAAIVESAMDCIVTMDHLGKVIEFNPASQKTFGYTQEEVVGKEMAELIIPPDLRPAHRQGLLRYLETGEGPVVGQRIEIQGMRKDGSEFPVELAIQRVDMPGAPVFTGYLRDITQRKALEAERLALLEREKHARAEVEKASQRLYDLQRITDAALTHLSVDGLLQEVLERVTTILRSDISLIMLVKEDQNELAIRAAHGLSQDPSRYGTIPIGEQAIGAVALSREPLIVDDIASSDAVAPLAEQEDMRSLMVVPLVLENTALGVLIAAAREPNHFTEDDRSLLQLAAARIAAPIQNANLYEREHRIATQLQRSLLPAELPEVKGLTICERYRPGAAGLRVGGDWYDVFELPGERIGLVIGDVVSKGIRAASMMGQLRNSLRAVAIEGQEPSEAVGRLNRLTDSLERATMATLIYAVFEPLTGRLVYTTAGHPAPILRDPTGTRLLEGTGNVPLGVVSDEVYTQIEIEIDSDTMVLFYTDGLIEDPARDIDAGITTLVDVVGRAPEDLGEFCDVVVEEIFQDRPRLDDVALLAFRPTD